METVMKIGDVSRSRRFANPARLRWYAFHRSVRFALRMMKAEEKPSQPDEEQLHKSGLTVDWIEAQNMPAELYEEPVTVPNDGISTLPPSSEGAIPFPNGAQVNNENLG